MTVTPLVSCIMVTGKNAAHQFLAERALDSVLKQSYQNFEAIIINDGEYSLQRDDPRVREIRVPKGKTLGELRNVGLDVARGDWIAQFDDDDSYHPDRLTYQMVIAQPEGRCVLLEYQVRYSFPTNCAFIHRDRVGIAGTAVYPKTKGRYPAKRKCEDSDFWLQQFGSRRILLCNSDAPELYLRFFHGSDINTWDESHILKHLAGKRDVWELPEHVADSLKSVLELYKKESK